MDRRILYIGGLTALLGVLLLVVTPMICETVCCCDDDQGLRTMACDAMCSAVAVCAEGFDGMPALDAAFYVPFVLFSSVPQGILSPLERPPIASC